MGSDPLSLGLGISAPACLALLSETENAQGARRRGRSRGERGCLTFNAGAQRRRAATMAPAAAHAPPESVLLAADSPLTFAASAIAVAVAPTSFETVPIAGEELGVAVNQDGIEGVGWPEKREVRPPESWIVLQRPTSPVEPQVSSALHLNFWNGRRGRNATHCGPRSRLQTQCTTRRSCSRRQMSGRTRTESLPSVRQRHLPSTSGRFGTSRRREQRKGLPHEALCSRAGRGRRLPREPFRRPKRGRAERGREAGRRGRGQGLAKEA